MSAFLSQELVKAAVAQAEGNRELLEKMAAGESSSSGGAGVSGSAGGVLGVVPCNEHSGHPKPAARMPFAAVPLSPACVSVCSCVCLCVCAATQTG
jgi:hypothetical protein